MTGKSALDRRIESLSYLLKQPLVDVVAVGKEDQGDQQEETHHLGVFHEFIAGFAA